MQKIPCFFNLLKLYVIPTLRHAGREGGTAVVNKSRNFSTISLVDNSPSTIKYFKDIPKPMMHKIPIKIIYLTESLVNLSSSGFGYKIALIKLPLKVLNPV